MKQSFIHRLAVVAAIAAIFTAGPSVAAQENDDDGVIDLLFIGHGQREGSGYHLSHVFAPVFNRSLGDEKIRMRYVETLDVLNPEDLAATDALMLYANYNTISDDQEAALLEFVAKGGGFLPVHCASACFGHSQEFVDLVGARFRSHGYEEFSTTIPEGKETHPILQGYEGFVTKDETYVHADHNEDQREVLMLREDEPWTWTRTHGKGRVFYTAYGHDMNTWGQEAFHDLLIRGILWSVGEEKSEANRRLVASMPEMKYEAADTIPNYLKKSPAPQLASAFTPEESEKLSLVADGFEMQLFVAEPDIVNPIAFAWDEKGRLFVAESVDYPNNVDPNQEGNDRILICEDKDGDGRADTFTVFAEGLNIPTSLTPIDGGWIVAQAPHFLFLKDTNGDDKADVKYPINDYWGIRDTHAGPSNLRYGFDNKIWGAVGYSEVEKSTQGEFGQGVFRMDPDNGTVEPIGLFSNNTWGLGMSEDFEIFGSTANNAPAWHVPLWRPFTYERNPALPSQLSAKIDDFTQFFPITHKFLQVDAHGRYTAGAGFNLYTARAFPKQYWNASAFIGGPTGHLLGQFFLEEDGSSYVAQNRGSILSSVDEWLSPVFADVGPDGQLWVADWYNFIIQHNPQPSKQSAGFDAETGAGNAHVNPLRDRHHGRIYRIVAKGSEPSKSLDLSEASTSELVETLANDNLFWRMTAQRKLVREKRREAIPQLREIVLEDNAVDEIGLNTRVIHALWSLSGLGAFNLDSKQAESVVLAALEHPSAAVRKNAVMALTETGSEEELSLAASKTDDADPKTRLKALLALGLLPPSEERSNELLSRRSEFTTDPWLGRAFAYAVLENGDAYVRRLLEGGTSIDFANGFDNIEEVPEYVALKLYLAKQEGDLVAALGNWKSLPSETVAIASMALLDVWKTQLHEPSSSDLVALQQMARLVDADTQMQLKLRTAGLDLQFSKIDEEKYQDFVKQNTFEPQIWGWGRVSSGEELYMQHCVACHGSDAGGDQGLGAPSLRGMDNWYTQTQLQKFYAGVRGTHFKNPRGIAMKGALQFLDMETRPQMAISHLAHYLETLEANAPDEATLEGDPAKGKTLYTTCVACHGPDGQGNTELAAPKLTGKQDWYLYKQIREFQEGVRGSDPRDAKGAEMALMAKTLVDEQAIKDVVAYIRSLDTK
ncbi:ThuA domain-containing protein [Pelagicoccus enzymogenes]|uniref:PVC-type heme-binding CxxCH protein n=1 Tax=Pelagicoccus enzymogenes TaxID=2773457 RepID=UPI0028108B97|nr:PVC-type heme-binding CxxCH protein [Pelagicoccus enzymogenes]MDQ8200557.1 ThuA domain-containing protein [Pelagicoccus enzymogenes]